MKNQTTRTMALVRMALLVAVELIMAVTPLGYLRTAGLEISFLMVPVALGGILLGPLAGAVLGGVFGVSSFLAAFSSAFGAPLLALILWLMQASGAWWWLWVWLVWLGFNVFGAILGPTLIAPLFNRFTPLDDASLRERIEALVAR